jgi:hypothetical protein
LERRLDGAQKRSGEEKNLFHFSGIEHRFHDDPANSLVSVITELEFSILSPTRGYTEIWMTCKERLEEYLVLKMYKTIAVISDYRIRH